MSSTRRTHLLPPAHAPLATIVGVSVCVALFLAQQRVRPRFCVRKDVIGGACRRATCSLQCFHLYLLDVKDILVKVLEIWPQCAPTLTARVSYPQAMSLSQVIAYRRSLFGILSRWCIPYLSVFSFNGRRMHEHILLRGADQSRVRAALRLSAARVVAAESPNFSVEPVRDPLALVHYLSKKRDVRWPAPPRFVVCRMSRTYSPLSLKAGRIVLRAWNSVRDEAEIRCLPPSPDELEYARSSVSSHLVRWGVHYGSAAEGAQLLPS